MAINDLFKKVPIEVPNKSGFDESHDHNFSSKVGTLYPVMTDLLLPNDTVSLSVGAEIQLPPMATDFYGRVKAHFEAFFVPCRLVYGGWQDLITHDVGNGAMGTARQKADFLPSLSIPGSQMGPGSLSDGLGYSFAQSGAGAVHEITVPNPLKYLCYHKIYDDWYRDSRLQNSCYWRGHFVSTGIVAATNYICASLPYVTSYEGAPVLISDNDTHPKALSLADDTKVYSLRQRNFGKDYFTNATTEPQQGNRASVAFDTSGSEGAISISALRQANSLQRWLETNNIAGERYGDQIRAQFGIYPSDAAMQRSIYLGRQIIDVYNKSVYQQDGNTAVSQTENPFSSVGSKYGSPLGVGSGKLVDNFTATEHGYIFVIYSLVPDSIYGYTIDRDFWYNRMSDFPFPLLQGVGDEAISEAELIGYLASSGNVDADLILNALHERVFGYQQRYSNHKFKLDRVSGLLKDDQSLGAFALQRSFEQVEDEGISLGSDFIQIPTDYLDGVSAVAGDVSKYGCWVDSHFNYHKVSTLAAYSIPTLGDLKNTHTEVIPNGGTRL